MIKLKSHIVTDRMLYSRITGEESTFDGSFTLICDSCKNNSQFTIKRGYTPEHRGGSETMPSSTTLKLQCAKCGATCYLWSDWSPTEISLGK